MQAIAFLGELVDQIAAVLPGGAGDENARSSNSSMQPALLDEIAVDHHRDQLLEVDRRSPAELLARFRGVSHEEIDLSGT